jgi:hypothetical protein
LTAAALMTLPWHSSFAKAPSTPLSLSRAANCNISK